MTERGGGKEKDRERKANKKGKSQREKEIDLILWLTPPMVTAANSDQAEGKTVQNSTKITHRDARRSSTGAVYHCFSKYKAGS